MTRGERLVVIVALVAWAIAVTLVLVAPSTSPVASAIAPAMLEQQGNISVFPITIGSYAPLYLIRDDTTHTVCYYNTSSKDTWCSNWWEAFR